MIFSSSSGLSSVLTSTSRPAPARRMRRPSSLSLSLTNTLGISSPLSFHQDLHRRAEADARGDRMAVLDERRFDRGQGVEDVHRVVIAEVADAEDLALGLILAAGDGHVELIF